MYLSIKKINFESDRNKYYFLIICLVWISHNIYAVLSGRPRKFFHGGPKLFKGHLTIVIKTKSSGSGQVGLVRSNSL